MPSPIKHVIHIQFDNVHFSRDNPEVPSDLEQMPHLLDFIERKGTLLANEHTPLIAHTTDDLVTGLTGVYGDQHGLPVSNSFEYYNNSSIGSYNTSAFTYWTDRVAPDPADATRALPFQMIDSHGNNLQAPWVPFVNAGCNVGAVSTANMVLENQTNDVNQVFGASSPEAQESSNDRFNDFVGIAVHCADASCGSVGSGSAGHAKAELGGQGFAALYGHKYVAAQVSPITETDGTPITGFTEGFDPTPSYTLGYMRSLLEANVPVVYGYIADAHDSRNDCASTTPSNPIVSDTANGQPCGAYAPGELGYVAQLKQWDAGFAQFFAQLDKLGINSSNTLFVIHSDENDHFAGTPPLNPGCNGISIPCKYDRTRLGEITTDLPLLLQQQDLYTSSDLPYGIDFDSAPGFWLKGHPANGIAPVRKLEGALAAVTFANPYTNSTQKLFRFLIDEPGLKALHMLTSDANRTPGVVGFGQENNFNTTSSLIFKNSSSCNRFPGATDATCLDNGFIWIHGDFAPDINHTWAALIGPGVANKGVDRQTWADHTDLRPTMMTLLCLKDGYAHEGRALVEDLDNRALPDTAQDERGRLESLGQTFKQLNAPVGSFGSGAIQVSTIGIEGEAARYTSVEDGLSDLVDRRDALASSIEGQLEKSQSCAGSTAQSPTSDRGSDGAVLEQLNDRAQALIDEMQRLADR
ncbi:MAG: hypothetical protein JOZ87_05360 [Chloroflexi bacterium]|nr:hypothetical protein [Chloroflexota bacterium]